MNASTYRKQRDAARAGLRAAVAVLRLCQTADRLIFQPLTLSGAVTPDSPGGQTTATLPDGTKVARYEYAESVRRLVEMFLCGAYIVVRAKSLWHELDEIDLP